MELGYWGIKGVAEPIRLLIAYLQLDVTEFNPGNAEEWFQGKKKELETPFPNLPYLKHGEHVFTESGAIPHYIIHHSNKPELLGKDLKDQTLHHTLEGVLNDIRQNLFKAVFLPGDHAANISKALEPGSATDAKFQQLSKFLGEKDFLLGYLTYADFRFAYISTLVAAGAVSLGLESPASRYPNLTALTKRVFELPNVKEVVGKRLEIPFMPPTMIPFPLLTHGGLRAKLA